MDTRIYNMMRMSIMYMIEHRTGSICEDIHQYICMYTDRQQQDNNNMSILESYMMICNSVYRPIDHKNGVSNDIYSILCSNDSRHD